MRGGHHPPPRAGAGGPTWRAAAAAAAADRAGNLAGWVAGATPAPWWRRLAVEPHGPRGRRPVPLFTLNFKYDWPKLGCSCDWVRSHVIRRRATTLRRHNCESRSSAASQLHHHMRRLDTVCQGLHRLHRRRAFRRRPARFSCNFSCVYSDALLQQPAPSGAKGAGTRGDQFHGGTTHHYAQSTVRFTCTLQPNFPTSALVVYASNIDFPRRPVTSTTKWRWNAQ